MRWCKVLGHVDIETPFPAISAINDGRLWWRERILGRKCVGRHRSVEGSMKVVRSGSRDEKRERFEVWGEEVKIRMLGVQMGRGRGEGE